MPPRKYFAVATDETHYLAAISLLGREYLHTETRPYMFSASEVLNLQAEYATEFNTRWKIYGFRLNVPTAIILPSSMAHYVIR